MPIVPLKLLPTVTAELTPALNEAGISSSNLIRFKAKLPEKLGGWEKFYPNNIPGIPRDLHAWEDLNGTTHLAIATTGSSTVVDVITDGNLRNVSPQLLTTNFTPNFSTTPGSTVIGITDPNISNVTIDDAIFFNTPVAIGGLVLDGLFQIASITGTTSYTINFTSAAVSTATGTGAVPAFNTTGSSAVVSVGLPAHGQAIADNFTFSIPTTGNGLTIDGTYRVNTVPNVNAFTITAQNLASATGTFSMNSGSAQLVYYIGLGPTAAGAGYGLGGYGSGGYGTGILFASQQGSSIMASDWTLDNWGELLIGCPKDGGIYQWGPNSGFANMSVISAAPPFNSGVFVAMPTQMLIAYGSTVGETDSTGRVLTIGTQQDPLIVRWCDSENFNSWIASTENQAGSYRIPRGSLIVGGLQGPQQTLLWTDLALWAMVYQGFPLVWGFNEIMSGCGLIGPHACCAMRGGVYWMGTGNFFVLAGGGPQAIPCSVWDVVFQDLDPDNQTKCVAAPNSAFDEVNFFYPSLSGGTGEIDKYVKFNIEENSWDYGSLPRTAWTDQSVLGQPIGTTPTGTIYQHEVSPDADGQPLMASFSTGFFTISETRDLLFVDWLLPDMKWRYFNNDLMPSATVMVTIETAEYPNSPTRTFGPFNLTDTKEFINLRLRGKMIRLTYSSSDTGTWWRLGQMRYRANPDGRR